MKELLRVLCVTWMLGLPSLALVAQEPDEQEPAEEPVTEIEEVVVVTASRTEQKLHDVPASITVLSAEQIATTPADDYGDLLRNVPGLNVSQLGTRDVQVSSREATSSLSTGQLVMLDGRTLYLDFFGFVIWEYMPIDTAEIKQIEVVQGPGSAVWGANAVKGVVNVITKSPRELDGTYVKLGGGELETLFGSVTHAAVANDKVSYKLSASYYQQEEPYDRPTGVIPGTGTPYPDFENSGTEQPKFDLRLDYDTADDQTWSFSGGWAATDGLMHTGIGPFDIDNSSSLSYFKASWTKLAMNVTAFANILDGDAANLLTVGPDGLPLQLGFDSNTYNIDFTNTNLLGNKNLLTYGVNFRSNDYDLSIAPTGTDRDEYGIFVQDEILLGDHFRWVIGGRLDDIDPIGTVFSPRTTLMYSPTAGHTFRASYNKAFRAPSLIENNIDIVIINAITIPALPPLLPVDIPFIFPTLALGNPELGEEELEAFEVGYVGTFDKTTLTFAAYRNETSDATDFFGLTFYDSFNPPPGWPLPPFIPVPGVGIVPTVPVGVLPELFTYRNVGEIVNQGVELSVEVRPTREWRISANYSYQEEPEVTGILQEEVNTPPENRFNLTLSYDTDRFYANGNLNFVDDARWTDVLDARFHGPTESFTQVNLGIGWRFNNGKTTLALIGSNIFDEEVQQHVFGDIISRKISAELRFAF